MTKITFEKESEDTSSDQKNRLKRWTPKVKTGCLTCRKRRIKCDERKPQCLRCEGRHTRCEYQIPQPRIFQYEPLEGKYVQSKPTDTSTTVHRQPRFGSFTTEELRSIYFYIHRTGPIVAKYGHSRYDFWTQILPSAAFKYPAVKHCLAALALVDESITSPSASALIEQRIDYHHSAAIKLTIHETRPLAVVLMCMAAFYLESLRGNDSALVIHLESARKILDAEHAANASPDELSSKISAIVDECRVYALALPCPAIDHPVDWEALPSSVSVFSLDRAEHELCACIANLCRPAGQVPLALVRTNAILKQWHHEFVAVGGSFAAREESALALWNIGKYLIAAIHSLKVGHAGTHFEVLALKLRELQGMNPPPVRFTKPLMAVEQFIQKYHG